MNETLKIMKERFSCRSFTDKMPEDKDLMAIAAVGTQAPSGMDRQGWHIIVVKNKELMAEMEATGMEVLSSMDKSMYERILSRGGQLFYNAPCMIVLAIKEAYPKGAELVDLGILAQNIVLAATSLGLASLHCGFVGLAFAGSGAAVFKQRLQFPEGYEPGMGVLLGFADEPTAPHTPNPDKITVIE